MKNKTNLQYYFQKGINYTEYIQNEETLLQSKEEFKFRPYHELNERRMKRNLKIADKSIELNATQKEILKDKKILIITEGWCGDAAQIVPYAVKIGERAGIEVKLVYRDENTSLMNEYLTNGGMAIPVIILADEQFNPIDYFAPRPKEAQDIMLKMKASGASKEDITAELQKWYNTDKGAQIIQEILRMTELTV